MEVQIRIDSYDEGHWYGDTKWRGTVTVNHHQVYVTPCEYAHYEEAESVALDWLIGAMRSLSSSSGQ